jgi:hypothetical protein
MKTSIYFFLLLFFCVNFGFAQDDFSKVTVVKPSYYDVSPPLRDMPLVPESKADNSWKDGVVKNYFMDLSKTKTPEELGVLDPNLQHAFGLVPLDTTIVNVSGLGGGSYSPPDTHGAVGPNHYFQVVNCSYAIYNKSGVKIFGPASSGSVWSGMPNNYNDGDAIVLYDSQADRWVFSQFSLGPSGNGPYYQMVAVSQTPDPTGSWYRWEFQFSAMNDYPKLAVWGDGYYYSAHRFSPAGLYAAVFDRTKMLAGDLTGTTMQLFTKTSWYPGFGMEPTSCDGPFPPAGQPNDFFYFSGNNQLGFYEFHTDWVTPSNSTFTLMTPLTVNTFSTSLPGIPQKGTSQLLDAMNDRIMYRINCRTFADHQSTVLCHTVNAGSGIAGIRWYELRGTGSGWSVYQQGTYAPDAENRWMGSIAMDSTGNIGLGYSISSSDMYPSIRYTGRMNGDALGLMTLAEGGIINGGTYQLPYGGRNRWGDYSSLTVDPASPATFWYTQEYHTTSTSSFGWVTRIASFSFASQLSLMASATPSTICVGETTQLDQNATGGSGTYSYSWTSDPAGFNSSIKNPVATPNVTTRYIAHVDDGTLTKTDTITVTVNQPATANAGEDKIFCIVPVMSIIMIGQATGYSHVLWSTSGDGTFSGGDTSIVCVYTPGAGDKTPYNTITITLKAFALPPCTTDATDQALYTFSPCTGIPENSNDAFALSLSPNPSQGVFTIKITGIQNGQSNLTVTDIQGKPVLKETLNGQRTISRQLDISTYPKGIYLVKVQTADQVRIEKMVIQ